MERPGFSHLSGALLGLLRLEPRSGYALRKVFATTPMGHFSDSPGSIYPALARLSRQGLVVGSVENARTLRPRQVYRLTPKGLERLKAWLSEPVTRARATGQFDLLLLRFVFMPETIGVPATVRFLAGLERELAAHLAELRSLHRATVHDMPLAAGLGLKAGIEICATHLRWTGLAQRRLAARSRTSSSKTRRS